MKRKVTQITSVPPTENEYGALYALCNDGSIWFLDHYLEGNNEELEWNELPNIPQPEEGN